MRFIDFLASSFFSFFAYFPSLTITLKMSLARVLLSDIGVNAGKRSHSVISISNNRSLMGVSSVLTPSVSFPV